MGVFDGEALDGRDAVDGDGADEGTRKTPVRVILRFGLLLVRRQTLGMGSTRMRTSVKRLAMPLP